VTCISGLFGVEYIEVPLAAYHDACSRFPLQRHGCRRGPRDQDAQRTKDHRHEEYQSGDLFRSYRQVISRLSRVDFVRASLIERYNAGTLIQNRYSEMWSVLDFVSPGSFGTHGQWEDTIGRPLKAGLDYNASVKQLAEKQVSR